MSIWKSEQFIVEGSVGNATSFDVIRTEHTNLKGAVYTILKEGDECHTQIWEYTDT